MQRMKDKVAIIAGASSGIGRATAKLFAAEGAGVVIGARRAPELESLAAEIETAGGQAALLAGDVREEAYARDLVDLAVRRFGGLDVAFNNAGHLGAAGSLSDMSLEDWREALDTNLTAAFLAAKYQLPAMKRRSGGSLIFTSTFVGHTVGIPALAAYAAGKSGLVGLVRALAADVGSLGIRVNALLPGGTDTDMARQFAPTAEDRAAVRELHALKRMATPEEMARSVLYLASDDSSFTTGTAMLVDGGVSICRG